MSEKWEYLIGTLLITKYRSLGLIVCIWNGPTSVHSKWLGIRAIPNGDKGGNHKNVFKHLLFIFQIRANQNDLVHPEVS